MNQKEIIDKLKREVPRACEEVGIIAVYLFGSWARGDNRPDSDVDLGVFVEAATAEAEKWPPREIVLEGRLASATGLPVEVRILNTAPLSLSGKVLEEGILIHSGDEVSRVRLEVAIRGQYLDFKPRLEELHRLRLKAFAERGFQ
jgi:predicted nucleotidyltransferase